MIIYPDNFVVLAHHAEPATGFALQYAQKDGYVHFSCSYYGENEGEVERAFRWGNPTAIIDEIKRIR